MINPGPTLARPVKDRGSVFWQPPKTRWNLANRKRRKKSRERKKERERKLIWITPKNPQNFASPTINDMFPGFPGTCCSSFLMWVLLLPEFETNKDKYRKKMFLAHNGAKNIHSIWCREFRDLAEVQVFTKKTLDQKGRGTSSKILSQKYK